MFVLAIDTSSPAVTAGVVTADGAVVAERAEIAPRGHGELLAPSIAGCLHDAGIAPAELTAIVAGTGPGPYTGLRVGLVTAAALAHALDIPSYGVCSLDAIAGPQLDELIVATDARRNEVYWARYDRAGNRVDGPHVSKPADVPTHGAAAMAGRGAGMYAAELGLVWTGDEYPRPAYLVRLAFDRIRGLAPGEPLTPLYLRRPDAVVPGAPKTVTQR